MRENKRIIKEVQHTVVDTSTGEIKSVIDTKESRLDSEPDYVKLYLSDIGRVFGLPNGSSSVMYEMLKRMDYDNLIAITPIIRQVIAHNLNTSVDVVNHSVARLVKEGIFTRIGSGTYMANPNIFAKGKWVDIKNMRLSITYSADGRSFKAERNVSTQTKLFEEDDPKQAVSGLPIYMCT